MSFVTVISNSCLLLVLFLNGIVADFECHDALSCNQQNITFPGPDNDPGDLECFGSRTCEGSILNWGTDDEDVECYGAYSCFQAIKINSQRTINCGGLNSCSQIGFMTGRIIYCDGQLSCYNTTMYIEKIRYYDAYLYCRGERSCANSIIFLDETVELSGYLSAQNTTFYTNRSTIYFNFYGPRSGDNATIFCGNNHLCSINCHVNACNYLTLKCQNENNPTCTFSILCANAAEFSINCPNGYKKHENYLAHVVDSSPFLSSASSLLLFSIDENVNNNPCYDYNTTMEKNNL